MALTMSRMCLGLLRDLLGYSRSKSPGVRRKHGGDVRRMRVAGFCPRLPAEYPSTVPAGKHLTLLGMPIAPLLPRSGYTDQMERQKIVNTHTCGRTAETFEVTQSRF